MHRAHRAVCSFAHFCVLAPQIPRVASLACRCSNPRHAASVTFLHGLTAWSIASRDAACSCTGKPLSFATSVGDLNCLSQFAGNVGSTYAQKHELSSMTCCLPACVPCSTGGVRCERASAYLREKGPGFDDVFQLSGEEKAQAAPSMQACGCSSTPVHPGQISLSWHLTLVLCLLM